MARLVKLPKDQIEGAIKRGAGVGKGGGEAEMIEMQCGKMVVLVEEGAKVAVIVTVVTDNRNQTAGKVWALFEKFGGSFWVPVLTVGFLRGWEWCKWIGGDGDCGTDFVSKNWVKEEENTLL